MTQDEGGKRLGRILDDAEPLRQCLAGSLQGGEFVMGDIVAAHVDAHEGARGADDGHEQGAQQGPSACLRRSRRRPDALGIALGAHHAQDERQATAHVLEESAGKRAAIAVMDALDIAQAVVLGQGRGVIDGVHPVAESRQSTGDVPHHDTGRQ